MPRSDAEIKSDDEQLVDLALILNLVAYASGALGRHPRLALSLIAVIFGLTASTLFLLPKTYHVQTKVLAQRNQALALKGDNGGEALSHSAVETVMRRDNLLAIVRQTDLVREWYLRRAPLPHVKDLVFNALVKPETEQEKVEWMADVIQKRLSVETPNEGLILVGLEWPDPVMALRIVNAAQQNYLESRQATEVTAIAEQIAILQNHARGLRTDIDTAVDAIEKLRAERLAKPVPTASASAATLPMAPTAPVAAAAPRRPSEPDPELTQLKATIEAKQRAINDLEEFRRRRLSELNASLAEKSAMYTDNHPAIIDLRQTIASLSSESPQVQSLRTDLVRLQRDFDEKSAAASAESRVVPVINPGGLSSAPPPLPGSIIRIEQEPSDDRDPAMMYARNQLKDAMDKYATLRGQIESAQIDFDTAEAAFKYRYSVIEPPVYPKKPAKPNAPLVFLAGLIGAFLVAVLASVAVDLHRGRFVAGWQVERVLDLPTLAEVDVATLAKHKIE
jgi:uncharacterized protein involved in exopolysaccharide biosynthesis